MKRNAPDVPGRRPGSFAVKRDGAMIGKVTIDRGHVRPRPGG